MSGMTEWAGKHWLTGEPVVVQVEEGRIAAVRPGSRTDSDLWIAPGLIDVQVNGINGIDYNNPDTTPEQIVETVQYMYTKGVVRFYPTIITRDSDTVILCIRNLVEARKIDPMANQAIIGIHLEGPYISGEDGPRGAHAKSFVRDPDWNEFLAWQEAAEGTIRKVTLAPERAGAIPFIERLTANDVIAAIGHTNASEAELLRAVDAGASMSTHLGNGAHPYMKRYPNYIWDQLADDRLWAGLIADGHHLPPNTLKAMIRTKGRKAILVSDATHFEGYSPGQYVKRNYLKVELREDGRLQLVDNPDILSGAAVALDKCVERVAKFGIATLGEAISMASLHPAEMLGIAGEGIGTLSEGAPADFILYRTNENHDFHICRTIVQGRAVYEL